MFKDIRRKDRQLGLEEAEKILENAEYGVLCLNGDYPYGVPVSYVYRNKKIYIHCATEGHKLDLLKKDGRVSFTAVGRTHIWPELFSADYESAVLFGKASLITDEKEIHAALLAIAAKYAPGHEEKAAEYTGKYIAKTAVIRITADHITGKRSMHRFYNL